ncbi:pentapeptide repeat-containing protein [Streptomyces albus]|uniref:pentapeptide repeat-containing protein n=1 Tax=Streptomyces albus TaxID=1888 RepID=UPI000AF63E95|nr:pentapeptide repeat-containing protein [Streptomyces albus]
MTFSGDAEFDGVAFSGDARFGGVAFSGDARFGGVAFSGGARFGGAAFSGDAEFDGATFSGDAGFGEVIFSGDARFKGARFEATARLGPLVCGATLVLDGALFSEPTTLEAAACAVTCDRTRWASTATLRFRHAELDLSDAVLEFPLMVTARPTPFPSLVDLLPETLVSGRDPGVRLTSVDGVDAAHLVLHDIDLSACRFAGAVHLDQLRVDGWCTFATTPTGVRWHRLVPRWWSLRSTLAEEHHWRARRLHATAARGWTPPPREDTPALKPAALAALYRQVRKSLEDGKNEPDAADFYYGECEMRRHDTTRSRGERALLTAYWALSGYGLRAGRALAWLLGAMTVTLLALLLWGLPVDDPKPTTTGRQVAVGQEVNLITDTPNPANPTGSWPERITTERFEKALRVVINSVVFRSSGQDLTTAGTYTEMASRLAEPVLLGLAVLAIRSRVKR